MRLILAIIFFCYSCLSFGQDSLHIDNATETIIPNYQDNIVADSAPSTLNKVTVNKRKKKKKVQQVKMKEEPVAPIQENSNNIDVSGSGNGFVIIGILLILIAVIVGVRN